MNRRDGDFIVNILAAVFSVITLIILSAMLTCEPAHAGRRRAHPIVSACQPHGGSSWAENGNYGRCAEYGVVAYSFKISEPIWQAYYEGPVQIPTGVNPNWLAACNEFCRDRGNIQRTGTGTWGPCAIGTECICKARHGIGVLRPPWLNACTPQDGDPI